MSDSSELQMEDGPVKKRQVLSKFGPKCKMGLFAIILLTVGFVIAASYVEGRLWEIDARYKRELQNLREEFNLRLAAQTCIEDLGEEMGSRCRDGKDGKDGRDGVSGINGKDGEDGLPGPRGDDGSPGSPGTPGGQGPTGSPGLRGIAGRPGNATKGENGIQGETGAKGSQGLQGAAGIAGPPGSPGAHGSAGLPGVRGLSGAPGLPGNTSESGSVYTRWGRTTCDGDTSVLYHGVAAAAHYYTDTGAGGGVNYQCLHPQPEYNNYNNGGMASIISGAEYESQHLGLFPNAADEQNVPCARCYTSRSAVVMIPSRRSCNPGWTKEYEGYLMSSFVDHNNPTTYECVDRQPEYIAGLSGFTYRARFYFVKPDCGHTGTTGHCPPYDAYKQLTCVVCSR